MRSSTLRIRANVEITTWDASTPALEALAREGRGIVLARQRTHNLVVLIGRNLVRDFLYGDPVVGLRYFGIGTSNAPIDDTHQDLVAPVLRVSLTQRIKAISAITLKYFLPSTALNGQTLREAGLFTTQTGTTLFARALINPEVVKDATIAQTFSWVVTMTSI